VNSEKKNTDAKNAETIIAEPLVGCVIVNWNGWRDTVTCLDALRSIEYSRLFVVVVDNGSSDDSVARIQAAHPAVRLVQTGKNLGFSGGNNAGIREVMRQEVKYVWLLNNDTQPAPGALRELVRTAEADFRLGAVGSVLHYAEAPQKIQAWGGGWINLWNGYSTHATAPPKLGRRLDFLTAASMLVRRKSLEDVGLMDDRFFLYWEDAELCFRLRKNGWNLGVARHAIVLHKVNASTGKPTSPTDRHFTSSAIRFLSQYSPVPLLAACLFLSLRILHRALAGRVDAIRNVWQGVQDYRNRDRWAALPLA
jgi:GT2 family glycosyltransferase